ncbi:MAG: hypothetical protein LKM39_00350 [Chiayiivirga sp.]|nr:hypothetical protein [Chiayiivirga sp.]
MLVFLPGEREIRDAHLCAGAAQVPRYRGAAAVRAAVGPDQDRVFNPGPAAAHRAGDQRGRNLADGAANPLRDRSRRLARVKRYSARQKLDRLHIEAISQASADQRKGRCGRIAAGRVRSAVRCGGRLPVAAVRVHRSGNPARRLSNVILRMLALGLGDVEAVSLS